MTLREYLVILKMVLFSRIRHLALGKYATGILYTTENGLLIAAADDAAVGRKLAFQGRYNPEALEGLRRLITKESTVCFVGCHIGSLLVPVAGLARSVVGYEANPFTYRLLEMNVKINNLQNVSLFNKAVGDREGTIEFYASRVNPGGSKIKPKIDKFAYRYDKPQTILADVVTLDAHSNGEFDVIVMDIEGSEYFALKGMQNTLRRCRHLQIEYVPHHLENVSGVSNEEFLSVFAHFFNYAREVGPSGKEFRGDEILALLNSLQKTGKSADLVFSK
jgi:FkbM family methyltransferase